MDKQDKIAVLIDAENVSKKYIKLIMDEVSDYGIATYKRIYGDFTNPSVMAWQDALRDFALTPVFQFNYTKGKNASDSALIIDAMDILYSGKVNGFCLVTSDSDFTKLAIRLREAGMIVIGMGNRRLRILWYRPARHSNSLIYCIRRAWKNRRRTRSFLKLRQQKRQNRLRQSVPRTNAIRRKPRRQRQSPIRLKLRILRMTKPTI